MVDGVVISIDAMCVCACVYVCVCVYVYTRIDYLLADILPVYLHQVLSDFWRNIVVGESIDPKAIKLLKRFQHKLVTFGCGPYETQCSRIRINHSIQRIYNHT